MFEAMQPLARAHGQAVLQASIRNVPDDFQVQEIDAFAPSGHGEHLLLTVEKRGMNTAFAAKQIAAWAGVAESAIGYAGLKDRHALTRQRFSVWLPKKIAPAIGGLQTAELRVLESHWHARKLPRGALAGNRFKLTLQAVQGDHLAIDARLRSIASCGVPNYFGEQRFGRAEGNLAKALAMFAGKHFKREQRSILLSAARSVLFNRVLSARVSREQWNRALPGDVFMLNGSRSIFGPEALTEAILARVDAGDLHPTGPLWGSGELRTQADALRVEQEALADAQSVSMRVGLEHAGMRQERRSLRLPITQLAWRWTTADELQLEFSLPPGSYATVVLDELGRIANAAHVGTGGAE